jgi:hypothetical protein
MTDHAEAFPPGEPIPDLLDELKYRLAEHMLPPGVDPNTPEGEKTLATNLLVIDLLLAALPDPQLTMGPRTAIGLSRALGFSAEGWLNLDASWREWLYAVQGVRYATYKDGTGEAWLEPWRGWNQYCVEEVVISPMFNDTPASRRCCCGCCGNPHPASWG